jgi:hypothetical protein
MQKIAIIGAGIFGTSIALELSRNDFQVDLFEVEDDIMLKASKKNHNRIHYGYHYPRSIETANQSLEGLISFYGRYKESIINTFPNYYCISNQNSNVTTKEYIDFCEKVGLTLKESYPSQKILNRDLIESSFLVEEPIFDWDVLQGLVKKELENSNVNLKLNCDFRTTKSSYDFIINSTFAKVNEINSFLGVEEIKLKLQDVVVPIFNYDSDKFGLTVMDGPFCSIMPRGFNKNNFLLYHVKESLISSNIDEAEFINKIFDESKNYYPFLSKDMFVGLWRTERALPVNSNDERLSEIYFYNNKNYLCVFSAKITTCVKIAKQIRLGLQTGDFGKKIIV